MTTPSELPAELPVLAEVPQVPPLPPSPNLRQTLAYIDPAPVIPGEVVSNYDTLLARVSGAVNPADILEEMWVRDIVDLMWDTIRLRRLKAALLTSSAHKGMQEVLLGLDVFTDLGRAWAARDPDAVREVERLLAAAGLGLDHVMAQTLRIRIADIERIDRLLAGTEGRRNAALREIEAYRAGFARTLRRAAQDVEDAEYTVVAPAPIPAEQAA